MSLSRSAFTVVVTSRSARNHFSSLRHTRSGVSSISHKMTYWQSVRTFMDDLLVVEPQSRILQPAQPSPRHTGHPPSRLNAHRELFRVITRAFDGQFPSNTGMPFAGLARFAIITFGTRLKGFPVQFFD